MSQPDNEHGAVENRDPNRHQAAGKSFPQLLKNTN